MARSVEERRKAKREGMARRRAADPAGVNAARKRWSDDNREHVRRTLRAYQKRRFFWARACHLTGDNRATYRQLAALWRRQFGLCGLTGERLNRENAELDHIVPRAKGGGDEIGNLRWATKVANRAKRDMTDSEFFTLCANVILTRAKA